jgi:ribose 5-phosphate isomerase A
MNQPIPPKDIAKRAAGHAAAKLIHDGMLVGLGTGSTAFYFIEALIERCASSNIKISAVATSERSAAQAKAGGIPLYDINKVTTLDITVDGADEIDHQKRMIKGGGGALLREKILASISREMVVIIDKEKLVDQLGIFPLPVEVVPFAHQLTLSRINKLGCHGSFRRKKNGDNTTLNELYVTDNGNYIVDIAFPQGCHSPEQTNNALKSIPGVVETGFFFHLAGRVIVGYPDGHIKIIP